MVVVYWAVGFYPFQWVSPSVPHPNAAQAISGGGFSFPQPGIAYTESSPKWVASAIKDNAFEVTLQVQPYDSHQFGPARMFTVSLDHYHRNFTIGQSGTDLVVRLRTRVAKDDYVSYAVPEVFTTTQSRQIDVDVKPRSLQIEVDGRVRLKARLPSNALSNWAPWYRLALGNEFTFERPWLGQIRHAAVRVRDRELAYAPEDLRMPERYRTGMHPVFHKLANAVLHPLRYISLSDCIVNLVGFLPLGFLLALIARQPRPLAMACMWCALLSLSIELGQLFLQTRVTSVTDLLLNTLGGGIGAWIGTRARIIRVKHLNA